MQRVALNDGQNWFDADAATKFAEKTWWNGNNHISVPTGSQWDHEALYYTRNCAWVLNRWSQWQGVQETYEQIDVSAAVAWLVQNGHTDVADLPAEIRAEVEALIASSEV